MRNIEYTDLGSTGIVVFSSLFLLFLSLASAEETLLRLRGGTWQGGSGEEDDEAMSDQVRRSGGVLGAVTFIYRAVLFYPTASEAEAGSWLHACSVNISR